MEEPDGTAAPASDVVRYNDYGFVTCVGAVLIGVLLPLALGVWFMLHSSPPENGQRRELRMVAVGIAGAFMFCGPLAFLFAGVLFAHLKKRVTLAGDSFKQLRRKGVLLGTVLAFLNLPAWAGAAILMPGDMEKVDISRAEWGLMAVRVLTLFLVAGSSCGLWISWQAWRYHHPECGIFPRYSLKTLLLIIFLWGALLALFTPARQG